MIRTDDIRKLSDFRQNAKAHLDRLAETGRIEVLTVNGEARAVVMSPRVFDEMAARIERLEATASARTGTTEMGRARRGVQQAKAKVTR